MLMTDAIQDKYDIVATMVEITEKEWNHKLMLMFSMKVVNASSVVDAGSVGGTAGQGITLSTSTILNVFTSATKKLAKLKHHGYWQSRRNFSRSREFISLYFKSAKVTDLGDSSWRTVTSLRLVVYNYTSNNTTGSAVLALATNPTANDTVTIQRCYIHFRFIYWDYCW